MVVLPLQVCLLRFVSLITASTAFGLIAAASLTRWTIWAAIGLGFLFGVAFVGEAGCRIAFRVAYLRATRVSASWSGVTAVTALYAAGLWALLVSLRLNAAFVLPAFGMAINIAYIPAKLACLKADCCHVAHARKTPADVDLRWLEIAMTVAVLLLCTAFLPFNIGVADFVAIGGHLFVRVLSRRLRNIPLWVWPRLRMPGSEMGALVLLLGLSAAAVL